MHRPGARRAAWESASSAQAAPSRERAALIVGRMWAEERGKGHDQLLETWPSVRRQVPDAELWIAGGGDDVARLVAKARDRGVADAVHFLGRVPDAELGALYRRASVFAMPSRQEGFGLVYAEAMWSGLPCIGTTADAASQVIVAGETGELVPYGDVAALGAALVGLLSDRERAARMGEAGRRRAREHFGYSRFRADLLAALELDWDARAPRRAPCASRRCRLPALSEREPRTRMPDYTATPPVVQDQEGAALHADVRRPPHAEHHPRPVQHEADLRDASGDLTRRAPSDKHVGVIGCGIFGFGVLGYFLTKNHGKVIRGVLDHNAEPRGLVLPALRARLLHDRSPTSCFDDPAIDLVFIASNHNSHTDYAMRALERGKAVHIEKPHVVTESQLRRLCATMRAHRRQGAARLQPAEEPARTADQGAARRADRHRDDELVGGGSAAAARPLVLQAGGRRPRGRQPLPLHRLHLPDGAGREALPDRHPADEVRPARREHRRHVPVRRREHRRDHLLHQG